jgi:hypothetical protein
MYRIIIAVLLIGFVAGCTMGKKDDCEGKKPVAVIKIQDSSGNPVD